MAGLPTYIFDTTVFQAVGDDRVQMNCMVVLASNVQVEGAPFFDPEDDFVYPVYFEVTGLRYHYVVSAWSDKVEIEVCDPTSYTPRSIMRPRNQSELLEAINTIALDFEDWLDHQSAA